MTDFAIEVRGLQKVYGGFRGRSTHALKGISLEVQSGRIFGLIGQNGAGKSTLVKILLGLSEPTGGSALVLGSSPRDSAMRRRLGYLPEQMRLPDYFRASDFLRYMGRLNRVDPALLETRIPELLAEVGLAGVRKSVREYSKGMQQRLGLAQALVNDPELILLDEPTDGLDPLGRKNVRDLLTRLRERGTTIFLNSHLLSEVELICDQIVILNKGRVVRTVTPAEFARGTGEYMVRMVDASDRARGALANLGVQASWQGNSFQFVPSGLPQLNLVLDGLRSARVEIESVEPVRFSLEQFFLQTVTEEAA